MSELSTFSIIKKDAIRDVEPKLLAAAAQRPDDHAGHDAGQVRLIEQTPTGALLEVVCGCGRTTRLNCLYSAPEAQMPVAAGIE